MALGQHKRAVGVFSSRRDAEIALRELRDSNFPMDRVSVITRDGDRQEDIAGADVRTDIRDPDDNKADEGAATGALTGGALGGLTGLLVGLGTLAIPGIGPIMLAGATATAIATTLAGTAIGAAAGSLIGALIGLGIPEDEARGYNDRVSKGDYLIMIEGNDEEISRAAAILRNRGIQDWKVYEAPNADGVPSTAAAVSTPRSALVHNHRAIGVFPHRRDAEAAIRDLRAAGFPMSQISLVGKDAHPEGLLEGDNVVGRTQADEGAKAGAATGAALGGLGGLLVGLGALAIPGVGPVIAGGALATALATAATGGAIGAAAGGLTGALVGLGIPDDRARLYNERVNRGDYLVMVDGTADEIRIAEPILSRHGIQDWAIFDAPDTAHTDRAGIGTPSPRTGLASHRAVGVFPHRRDAEAALRDLRDSGFNMDHVSVVGKDAGPHDQIAGVEMSNKATGNKADEGAATGAATGAALGGLGGLLVGLGALAIPGIGPVMAGGALATALATTATGGAIGAAAGGLTGALVGLGIPEERARFYNDRVNRGDYLVMLDGSDEELRRAQPILSRHGIQDWGFYDASDVGPGRSDRDDTPDYDRSRTVTREVIDRDVTPNVRTSSDYKVVDNEPQVIIVDKRDQTP
ncbi:MAG: general stress protein [Potamolinea sp.]